jgi:hypothetical protein
VYYTTSGYCHYTESDGFHDHNDGDDGAYSDEFRCPECKEVLFYNSDDADEFLRGEIKEKKLETDERE